MKKLLIISGGEYSPLPENFSYDMCIACDKGLAYAQKMNIRPDIILGDFDSMDKPEGITDIPVLTYPVEKDDTDTMLAIKKALDMGYKHIVISCALGKRLDHTLANIQSAGFVAEKGGVCEIISQNEYVRTLTGGESINIPKKTNHALSLFALSDKCDGLTISGAKYNVENVTVTNTFPLGCSNGWQDDEVIISLNHGILVIVESNMSDE